jgi:hypothetical protein
VNIPASYQRSMKVPGTREQVTQACVDAVRQSGFRVTRSDLTAGQVSAHTRISLRGWGESIHIYLGAGNQVDITSESVNGFTIIDFGKNRSNVNRIFGHLESLLGAGV